jgi:type I restriction enzyme, S subunit
MNETNSTPRLFGAAEVRLGRQRSPAHESGSHMTPYLRAANVKDGELDLTNVKEMNFEPAEQVTFSLRPGDVLVTEGSGSLASVGASAVWNGELSGTVCFQNTLIRLRPREGVTDGRYLGWWARSAYASGQFASIASGANIYHLSSERTKSLPAILPSLWEQRRIADFLDAEIGRIDLLTNLYQQAIDWTLERSQIFVDTLIASTKDSYPLKHYVRFREGPGIMASDFHDSGVPLIRISGLQAGRVTLAGANFLNPELVKTRWSQFRLRLGDYIISGSATMGAVSIVADTDVIGAIPYTGLIILRPNEREVSMEYVSIALSSTIFKKQIDLLKAGAAMQHFGPTHLSQVTLPFPCLTDQERIAGEARRIMSQAAQLENMIEKQIALLTERRQALITAAVTGQIDVTTARGIAI